jgi:hypothetical protein
MTAKRAARLGRHGTPEEVADLVYCCCQIMPGIAGHTAACRWRLHKRLKTCVGPH